MKPVDQRQANPTDPTNFAWTLFVSSNTRSTLFFENLHGAIFLLRRRARMTDPISAGTSAQAGPSSRIFRTMSWRLPIFVAGQVGRPQPQDRKVPTRAVAVRPTGAVVRTAVPRACIAPRGAEVARRPLEAQALLLGSALGRLTRLRASSFGLRPVALLQAGVVGLAPRKPIDGLGVRSGSNRFRIDTKAAGATAGASADRPSEVPQTGVGRGHDGRTEGLKAQ